MRLYLSSFRLGCGGARLLELLAPLDGSLRTAVLGNALDAAPDDIRRAGVQRELDELGSLGLDCTELDVRRRVDVERLAEFNLVWVRGGNVFVLRRALAEHGADRALTDLMRRDGIVYGGYSAGACVLAPDLVGLEAVDDPGVVDRPLTTGLAILDRPFVPHVGSPEHAESALCDAVSAAYTAEGREHWALRDGEVLVIAGPSVELLRP